MKIINKENIYLVPAKQYEQLVAKLEDYELGEIVKERQSKTAHVIDVALDDL